MSSDKSQTTVPPLASLRDWYVGATENGLSEIRIVLADPKEAKSWLQFLFDQEDAGTGSPTAGQRTNRKVQKVMDDLNTTDATGIVPRLRGEWATLTFNETEDIWGLRHEAADEIERLRATVKELRNAE